MHDSCETHYTTRKTTCHQGETNEQDKTGSPDGTRVSKALVSPHAVLVDEVDDEHAEEG